MTLVGMCLASFRVNQAAIRAAIFVLALATGFLVGAPATAQTPVRHLALIIGIGQYDHAPPLTNPINDANDLATKLRSLGFDVVHETDKFDAQSLFRLILDFKKRIEKQRPDFVLFYFAGHGLQQNNSAGQLENFLIPGNANITSPDDLTYGAIPLSLVLKSLTAEGRKTLALIDACRDNPFPDAGKKLVAVPGLTEIGADSYPGELMVVPATRAGAVAYDGGPGERNSPFAKAVIENIGRPNLELGHLFDAVKRSVIAMTKDNPGGKQEPYVYGRIPGDFLLNRTRPSELACGPVAARAVLSTGSAAKCYELLRTCGKNVAQLDLIEACTRGRVAEKPAGDQAEAEKQYQMGLRYRDGKRGYPIDKNKAIQHLTSAAELGHTNAMFWLANLYERQGMLTDAVRWLEEATSAGHPQAKRRLRDLKND